MTAGVMDGIAKIRLVPVIVLDKASSAAPLAKALVAGGLPIMEVTFRSNVAPAALAAIAKAVPEVLLGAGTVLTPAQVDAAKDAGARFIVTPGFNPAVVTRALELDLPIVPGINNPSGVEQAMSFGLDLVKFFPAEATGGVSFLKALAGPYRGMRFIPTGGIGPNNLSAYLEVPSVLACGGSWMVEPRLISENQFGEITQLARAAVERANNGD